MSYQSEYDRLAALTAADYPKPDCYKVRPPHLKSPVTIKILWLPGSQMFQWTATYQSNEIGYGMEWADNLAKEAAETCALKHGRKPLKRTVIES